MKNSFSKFLNTTISLLALNILCATSLTLNVSDIDKFQIENNLNAKVANVISNFYDETQFAVTSNVLLLGHNNLNNNSISSSFGALELEGILPAVPQKAAGGVATNDDNYKIQIQDIFGEVAGVYPKIMKEGTVDAGAWSCGMVAGLIHDIPSCKELVERIVSDAEEIINNQLNSVKTT